MTWNDVLAGMEACGLNPIEETYMENYGKILTAQRPEFRDRNFKCTFGMVKCEGIDLEVFLFPDEYQRNDFMDVVGADPWWLVRDNAVIHFPECDPAVVAKVLAALRPS